jgi:hypothetical protein
LKGSSSGGNRFKNSASTLASIPIVHGLKGLMVRSATSLATHV